MKRWNRLGALEELGSLLSPTEILAACPMCHSREIWVEKHPNSARSLSIMCRQCRFQVSLLPRAQAIAAWNGMGNGRIVGAVAARGSLYNFRPRYGHSASGIETPGWRPDGMPWMPHASRCRASSSSS